MSVPLEQDRCAKANQLDEVKPSGVPELNGHPVQFTPPAPFIPSEIHEEWRIKNVRRLELAKRKARNQLTAEEETEFADLQKAFFEYVDTIFPRPKMLDQQIEAILAKYENETNT